MTHAPVLSNLKAGFPQRLENEKGHGKNMEHEKLTKSHGILISVMKFYPRIVPNLNVFATTKK